MRKPLFFGRKLFASAMLLLCGIFLQSCTEEMPILKPLNGTTTGSVGVNSQSTITLNYNNTINSITGISPSTIVFSTLPGGTAVPLYKSYFIAGNNGNVTNNILYGLSFHTDTIGNNRFIFDSSQLMLNLKTYTTFNLSSKVNLKIDKLDDKTNTTSGSFGYYVYDDILKPKDSIYVTGTFNIAK